VCGRPLEELLDMGAAGVEKALDGLPEDRAHAAQVVAAAVRAAAADALGRRGRERMETRYA
jgi:hypothetical protein